MKLKFVNENNSFWLRCIGLVTQNYAQRGRLAAGWEFEAASAPMTKHIKERNFYLKRKANYKMVRPHNKRLVEN
jgi:hypothetical protein